MVWAFVCFKSSLSALHGPLEESSCVLLQIPCLLGDFSQEYEGPDCGSYSIHFACLRRHKKTIKFKVMAGKTAQLT